MPKQCVVPVSARDNGARMRLLASRGAIAPRREGFSAEAPSGKRTAPGGAAVSPVAAEPDHATRMDPGAAGGSGGRADPCVAPLPGRQPAWPLSSAVAPAQERESGGGSLRRTVARAAVSRSHSPLALPAGRGRGPALRWDAPAHDLSGSRPGVGALAARLAGSALRLQLPPQSRSFLAGEPLTGRKGIAGLAAV
jgi:hypothetical protein